MTDDVASVARERRERKADRYKPRRISLLLVAEAPPAALDRYFYFDNVHTKDDLFRYVCRGALGKEPDRSEKAVLLGELRDKGMFLIDLQEEPIDGTPLRQSVPRLIERCRALEPRKIILIKATVFDVAYSALKEADLPVSNVRVPFPGSGRQREFTIAFSRALEEVSA